MANDVFANGREISCKSAAGKSICAFPDVCFTPPITPPMPLGIPIPYPNTGKAKDTTDGSKSVKITKKEIILKNKSHFKKSFGDMGGKTSKKGLITSKLSGKVYFNSWSMNVKIESENVVRHIDITTHNHGSLPGNSPVWPYVDTLNLSSDDPCHDSVIEEQSACAHPGSQPNMVPNSNGVSVQKGNNCSPRCAAARSCALPQKKDDKSVCCTPDTTGDHLLEVNSFTQSGGRQGAGLPSNDVLDSIAGFSVILETPKSRPRRLSEFTDYNDEIAPTACVRPPGSGTNHNRMQSNRDSAKRRHRNKCKNIPLHMWGNDESFWTYDEAAKAGVKSHQREFQHCNPECTRAQLDAYHHDILPGNTKAEKNRTPIRTYIPGN